MSTAALSLPPVKLILIRLEASRQMVERWGASPASYLERLYVSVWLRSTRIGHTITLHEVIVVATLGMPSPGCSSPARTVVPTQRSPRLGELVVMVSWVFGREEDHVIAVAKGHEL
jgi:hypothetical protein